MPKTFFISDLHMNNTNIIDYCNRPFANAQTMNEELIRRWNEVVSPEDTVFVVGDFIMGTADLTEEYLFRFNGHIILVRGNHDTERKLEIYKNFPDKIKVKDIEYLRYKGLWFICCHFPIDNPAFKQMVVKDNSEVVLIHGHVHDKAPFADLETHTFNVSVDVINFTPVDIEVIYEMVRNDFREKGALNEKR